MKKNANIRTNIIKLALAIVLGAYVIPSTLDAVGLSTPLYFAISYCSAGYFLHEL